MSMVACKPNRPRSCGMSDRTSPSTTMDASYTSSRNSGAVAIRSAVVDATPRAHTDGGVPSEAKWGVTMGPFTVSSVTTFVQLPPGVPAVAWMRGSAKSRRLAAVSCHAAGSAV